MLIRMVRRIEELGGMISPDPTVGAAAVGAARQVGATDPEDIGIVRFYLHQQIVAPLGTEFADATAVIAKIGNIAGEVAPAIAAGIIAEQLMLRSLGAAAQLHQGIEGVGIGRRTAKHDPLRIGIQPGRGDVAPVGAPVLGAVDAVFGNLSPVFAQCGVHVAVGCHHDIAGIAERRLAAAQHLGPTRTAVLGAQDGSISCGKNGTVGRTDRHIPDNIKKLIENRGIIIGDGAGKLRPGIAVVSRLKHAVSPVGIISPAGGGIAEIFPGAVVPGVAIDRVLGDAGDAGMGIQGCSQTPAIAVIFREIHPPGNTPGQNTAIAAAVIIQIDRQRPGAPADIIRPPRRPGGGIFRHATGEIAMIGQLLGKGQLSLPDIIRNTAGLGIFQAIELKLRA